MPKSRSKALKIADQYAAYLAMKAGEKPRRFTNKDGSITTKSTVPVEDKPEATVLKECIEWLRKHGCVADRMNVGAGDLGGGFRKYGITGAGDIIGIMPDGGHFEVECKRGSGGRWSVAQQARAKKIRRNNAIYLIVHGVEELEHMMGEYL